MVDKYINMFWRLLLLVFLMKVCVPVALDYSCDSCLNCLPGTSRERIREYFFHFEILWDFENINKTELYIKWAGEHTGYIVFLS